MKLTTKDLLATFGLLAGLSMTGAATAAINAANENILIDGGTINVVGGTYTDSDPGDGEQLFTIDQSITLTATQWYNIQSRVVVLPGATLTIEPGTIFASSNNPNGASGSLVITNGAQIIAEGTKEAPIIFTSRLDLANWADDATHPTGKDYKNRGQWRAGMNEWGSLAILGDARIADDRQNGNNGNAFDDLKTAGIEGLPDLQIVPNGPFVNFYGGLNDQDDSGVLRYVSLSYGGDDFNPLTAAELNGMSWGGVGSEFDASHIEIFNNVDDGLEIFGGKANVKNLAIWNIGDDSLDVDQGWRGKAQFCLIVQGVAAPAKQGSGFGDNGIEADGADGTASAMPVTAFSLWNATVIGAPQVLNSDPLSDPDSSDRLIALRDNANVQIWNSVFMTDGEKVLNNDGDDGDGSTGYGADGTLSFNARWTTAASVLHDASANINTGAATNADLEAAYSNINTAANLLQIAGSVFYTVKAPGELVNVGVVPGTTAGSENTALDNFVSASQPIVGITREDDSQTTNPFVIAATKASDGVIGNISSLDPRAAGDAIDTNRPLVFQPPADGFYTTPTNFRGAVAPNSNWLAGWTGMSAIEDLSGNKILKGTANPADPTGLGVAIAPTISFQSVTGVFYEVVAVDANGSQRIVATVEGDGTEIDVADVLNSPLDASQQYIVRVSTF